MMATRSHGGANKAESDITHILNFELSKASYEDEAGEKHKVNHKNIDEATKASAINYIMSVLPPKGENSNKPKSVEDWLNFAGVPFKYQPADNNRNENHAGKLPFKRLYGVY